MTHVDTGTTLDARSALPRASRGRAMRAGYSRAVAMLKVALPSLAVVLVTLVVVWPQLQGSGDDAFPLSFAEIGPEAMQSQRLVGARYQSTDDSEQPFTVTADLAEETAPGSRLVRLQHPKADITLNDGVWLLLDAREGLYEQDQETLQLSGGVDLFHDGGYELHTERLTLNVAAGTADSTDPVAGQGPLGTLKSEGLRIRDGGKTVIFTGAATLVLHPESTDTPKAKTKTEPAR